MSESTTIDKTYQWLENSKNFLTAGIGVMALGVIGIASANHLRYTKADDDAIEAMRDQQTANIATLTEDEAKFLGILDDREGEEYPIDGIILDTGEQGVEIVDMNQVIRVWNANETFEDSIAEETDFGPREYAIAFSSAIIGAIGASATMGGVVEVAGKRLSIKK
jgi:hypothetical protein